MEEYKCTKCGNVLDKQTPFCPYCGAEISYPEQTYKTQATSIDNQETKTDEVQTWTDTDSASNSNDTASTGLEVPFSILIKKFYEEKKELVLLLAAVFILILIIIICAKSCGSSHHKFSNSNNSTYVPTYQPTTQNNTKYEEEPDTIGRKKYTLVIFKDETGDFYDYESRRICGVKKSYSTDEYASVSLSRKFEILGSVTDEIWIYFEPCRLFLNQNGCTDYLYNNITGNSIPGEKHPKADGTVYSFWLKDDEIEQFQSLCRHKLNIKNNKNEYTLVLYKEEEKGHLFDPDGSHVCGINSIREMSYPETYFYFALNKSIELYNTVTEQIYISGNRLYTNEQNWDKKRSATSVRKIVEGDATIYKFVKPNTSSNKQKPIKQESDDSISNDSSSNE